MTLLQVTAGAQLMIALTVVACDKTGTEGPENAAPSPNASIFPAPLSSQAQPAAEVPPFPGATPSAAPQDALRAAGPDGGTIVPQVMRSDEPLAEDPLSQHELAGISLQGEWRYGDIPSALRTPELNTTALEGLRKLVLPRMGVDLAATGRMRVTFESRAMPLARGSEVRARSDRYGHLVMWPGGSHYRVLPPGGLRSLLGEGRADAVPLVRPQSSGKLEGGRRLGYAVKKWELSTRTGRLVLEQARIAGAGEGGPLLCRFLSELLTIDASAAPCAFDDVPLRAQFNWPAGGSVSFEITRLTDKVDLAAGEMLVPPPSAQFLPGELPAGPAVVLTRDELASLRTRPLEGPLVRSPISPEDGLALHNSTDVVRDAFVDGILAASVRPGQDANLAGLLRGRYLLQWRSFLSDAVDAPALVDVPARASLGVANERDH